MNIAPLNIAPLNAGSGIAITPAPEAPGRGLDAYFRWEARTPTGAFVSPLDSVYSWQARRNANEPEWCQFSYSMDAPGADALVYPNEVWQYRNDALMRRYTIATQTRVDATARVVQIEGDGLMAQLGREMVTFLAEEDEDGDPIIRTVGQVIGLLLAEQNQTPKVRLGFVDSAIRNVQVVYGCEDKSILECLNELQRMTGGWFWVDVTRRLQFRRQRGFDAGNRVTLERNAQAIQQRTVYRDIVTRMIGIGKGASVSTATRVVVNDAAAQALYGVRIGYYTHKGITNEDALTKATTAALARLSGPRVTYDISALDISGDTVLDLTFDANLLTLGTRVNVVSGDIDLWTRVVGIHENGDSPIDVTLKFSNPAAGSPIGLPNDPTRAVESDIIDAILDIEQGQDRLVRDTGVLGSVASAIGAGTSEASLSNVAWWDPDVPDGNLPELMEDLFDADDPEAESYLDALENFIGNIVGGEVPTPGGSTVPIATTGAAGSAASYSRSDHVHVGMPWIVGAGSGDLDPGSNPAGVLGYGSTDLQMYLHGGSDVWARHFVTCETVNNLPAVPSVGMRRVFWRSTSGGTGDDQIWEAHAGQSRWYPSQKPTNKSGTP